jgi:hypothetical protein
LAATDGLAAQARDAGEPRDPAPAILLGQEADNQAPVLLVQSGDEVIQSAMLFRGEPIGMAATG